MEDYIETIKDAVEEIKIYTKSVDDNTFVQRDLLKWLIDVMQDMHETQKETNMELRGIKSELSSMDKRLTMLNDYMFAKLK